MENKHGTHGSNSFVWGLLIGALLATLVTTKKGRQILHNLADLGLEAVEDFIEEKTRANPSSEPDEEEAEEATADIESEITETEAASVQPGRDFGEPKKNGNGHTKKRLFKGIRRNK